MGGQTQEGKYEASKQFMKHVSNMVPGFTDIFDEESFYICAIVLIVLAIIGAFLASRYVTVKDAGHLD